MLWASALPKVQKKLPDKAKNYIAVSRVIADLSQETFTADMQAEALCKHALLMNKVDDVCVSTAANLLPNSEQRIANIADCGIKSLSSLSKAFPVEVDKVQSLADKYRPVLKGAETGSTERWTQAGGLMWMFDKSDAVNSDITALVASRDLEATVVQLKKVKRIDVNVPTRCP